jgi:hypothetical protein
MPRNFLPHQVQADDIRAITLVKMAAHGIADAIPERVQGVGLGENVVAKRPREVATLGRLFDSKDDLAGRPGHRCT